MKRKEWTLEETLELISIKRKKLSKAKMGKYSREHGLKHDNASIDRHWKLICEQYNEVREWEQAVGQAISYFDMSKKERSLNKLPPKLHLPVYNELHRFLGNCKPKVEKSKSAVSQDYGPEAVKVETTAGEQCRVKVEELQSDTFENYSLDDVHLNLEEHPVTSPALGCNAEETKPAMGAKLEEQAAAMELDEYLQSSYMDETAFADGLLMSQESDLKLSEGASFVENECLPEPSCHGVLPKLESYSSLRQQKKQLLSKANSALLLALSNLASTVKQLSDNL